MQYEFAFSFVNIVSDLDEFVDPKDSCVTVNTKTVGEFPEFSVDGVRDRLVIVLATVVGVFGRWDRQRSDSVP